MEFLFDSVFSGIYIFIVYLIFIMLPKIILEIYYNENILKRRKSLYIFNILWLIMAIFFVVSIFEKDGFWSDAFIIIYVLNFIFIIRLIINEYQVRVKGKSRVFKITAGFTKEFVSKEIDALNIKYPSIKINKSDFGSVTSISITANSRKEADILIDPIRSDNTIFKDLSKKPFKVMLIIYSGLLAISILYIVMYSLYHLSSFIG